MAAELEREREAPPHVGDALGHALRDLADQEVDAGQARGRALAPDAQHAPVEDRGSGALALVAHLPYMVRALRS